MAETPSYDFHMDVMFDFLSKIDVPRLVAECREPWWNQTLCRVNDCVVRLGVIRGEFHWHKHDEEDEFFFVLDGTLYIDVEGVDDAVCLERHQGYSVPRGVLHRTRAPGGVAMLMVERASVDPAGD